MNRRPVFSATGRIASALVTAANTSSQGGGTLGTDIFLLISAVAVEGTYIDRVRFILTGTAANTASAATVGRVFITSVSAPGATTSANTWMWDEITLPSLTADSSTGGAGYFDVPCNFILPAGLNIALTNHAAPAATTAWRGIALGGDY